MLKFDNTDIITGYIKQMLASFNLPKCHVYTKEHAKYKSIHGVEAPDIVETIKKDNATKFSAYTLYAPYIKDGKIQRYVNGKWEDCTSLSTNPHNHDYAYNRFELNHTRNLEIRNNIYDSYTHEYLGDYLRFQRDYNDIDLMPLYNCFSNKLCTNLSVTIGANLSVFNSDDSKYKIYVLPVKLFKKYTIAIDSANGIEIFCGFYDKYYDNRACFASFPAITYQHIKKCEFNHPFLYNKLETALLITAKNGSNEQTAQKQLRLSANQNEKNLKMFIKIPANCNSSITIIEGDVTKYNDRTFKHIENDDTNKTKLIKPYINKSIINLDGEFIAGENESLVDEHKLNDLDIKLVTSLQLLQFNTKYSYPFADRLIEYLVGHAITPIDTVSDNISRVQTIVRTYGITTGDDGIWDNKLQYILYEFAQNNLATYDILGYADKDIEKYYKSEDGLYLLSNVDIYK